MALRPEDLLIFKARGAKKEENVGAPAANVEVRPTPQVAPAQPVQAPVAPVPQAAIEEVAQPVIPEEGVPPVEMAVPEVRGTTPASGKAAGSVEAARGKFCTWHAWRPAYAVCGYCGKPYCYEDMVEFNNGYYCLEDIDKVSTTNAESVYTRYTNLGFVSAATMMLSFAVFVFFANAQLAYVLAYIQGQGLPAFLGSLNFSYGSLLLEAFLAVLALAAAVMIVVQTKRAFAIGMVSNVCNVALFSYLYLGSGTFYIGMIAAAGFVGLATLAYSRVTYTAYAETPFVESGPVMMAAGQQRF